MKYLLNVIFAGCILGCVTFEETKIVVEDEEKSFLSERKDLFEAIGKAGCESKALPASQQLPVEDAQIHAEHISLKSAVDGRTFKDVLKDYAKQIAKKQNDLGYGYHTCKDGSGVAFSTRAPWPFEVVRQNFKEQMSKHCRDIRIGFAPDEVQKPFLGKLFPRNVNSQRGYLSVECFPNGRANVGPQLWYMVNFNSANETPLLTHANTSIKSWLNGIRRQLKLQSLRSVTVADTDLIGKMFLSGVNHDLASLKEFDAELSESGYKVIGEARVVAKDPFSIANLLWHSAPHRNFLLNSEATGFIHLKRSEKNIFIMIKSVKK